MALTLKKPWLCIFGGVGEEDGKHPSRMLKDAQGLLLALHLEITSGDAQRNIWNTKDCTLVATCKANTLIAYLFSPSFWFPYIPTFSTGKKMTNLLRIISARGLSSSALNGQTIKDCCLDEMHEFPSALPSPEHKNDLANLERV